jgi:hypothetical protein
MPESKSDGRGLYYPGAKDFQLRCTGECGHIELSHKTYKIPNCFKFFGNPPHWFLLNSKLTKPQFIGTVKIIVRSSLFDCQSKL